MSNTKITTGAFTIQQSALCEAEAGALDSEYSAVSKCGLSTGKSAGKKAYQTPVLVHYGDVRDITLGPTVGIGESGNELGRRNPP